GTPPTGGANWPVTLLTPFASAGNGPSCAFPSLANEGEGAPAANRGTEEGSSGVRRTYNRQRGSGVMDDERRTLYQHLKRMQPRLEMYLGTRSIKRLEAYLHGYEAALSVHGIEEEGAPSFAHFPSWLELSLRIGVSRGWARALLDYC